ncbi:DNA repair protein [Streptococcus pantholopis]|uniref:DNA repair protein n=1 Tax=Streptococcus pantholopis TaxID=1811193 RepID=A0A172Q5C0_9STRE|nr:DNA repair protein [Streptococcus pantholopis]AND78646.1 DNA repair protein [Streptococcus pantholopis]
MLNKERKNLRKLKKPELLEIMLAQSEEIEALRNQLAVAEKKLADREIILEESGSLAEASLKLTNVFVEAQKAADLYLDNIKAKLGEEDGKADRS